jgi:hypothetical protein
MDKCISNENIFADLNFSIDMFDIFKTISSTTRIIFQAITCRVPYRNCLFENSSNDLNNKIILKSQIDSSNLFCKIQKAVYTILAFKDNTSKRRENYVMKKIVIIELN